MTALVKSWLSHTVRLYRWTYNSGPRTQSQSSPNQISSKVTAVFRPLPLLTYFGLTWPQEMEWLKGTRLPTSVSLTSTQSTSTRSLKMKSKLLGRLCQAHKYTTCHRSTKDKWTSSLTVCYLIQLTSSRQPLSSSRSRVRSSVQQASKYRLYLNPKEVLSKYHRTQVPHLYRNSL